MAIIFSLSLFSLPVNAALNAPPHDPVLGHLSMAMYHLERLKEGVGDCKYHHDEFLHELTLTGYTLTHLGATMGDLQSHHTTCVETVVFYHLVSALLSTRNYEYHLSHIDKELAASGLTVDNINIDIEYVLSLVLVGMYYKHL